MQIYCESLTEYKRLNTREVRVGNLLLGNFHPIRVQTMTTTDTMDTVATVDQAIRCIIAGSELIRITAPSKREAENLQNIKNELNKRGYTTPIVADIHFTPNAAEIAARIVEKVRINPGNYVDRKKFEVLEYTDASYRDELSRIYERFIPLVKICQEYGTAMRIGTNHGSLSDRIMSRYGDTPMGMVESAMEFLRIARSENYHQIVLSMKASNPQVMVHAYRLLVKSMFEEFGECYPLHLGVTEAGDGEDGRIKSAVGIGTLLEDGLGDTIRVSLTEEPELEIPVCKDLVKRYPESGIREGGHAIVGVEEGVKIPAFKKFPYDPFSYDRRETFSIDNIGGKHVPVVVADLSRIEKIRRSDLQKIGYSYNETTEKWNIADAAADYIITGHQIPDFSLPGNLRMIVYPGAWGLAQQDPEQNNKYFPIFSAKGFSETESKSDQLNFVMVESNCPNQHEGSAMQLPYLDESVKDKTVILCLSAEVRHSVQDVRRIYSELMSRGIQNPTIHFFDSDWNSAEDHLIQFATEAGSLLLDGFGDGICLGLNPSAYKKFGPTGPESFINSTAFGILQATRSRISKTEYISCPSCGRTLFDLQETTARIRAKTHHLKGVKIAIMGCIVNGPGEMADADFGYVGSGPGKITLYRGKEVVKRNVNSNVAVEELINILRENNAWVEPA